jgi:hypothetical protein
LHAAPLEVTESILIMAITHQLLAREWQMQSMQPGPDAFGYWNMDDGMPLDLTGLQTISTFSPPPFWLEETDGQSRLRPNPHVGGVAPPHHQEFYFEVVAVSTQRLQLALWLWNASTDKYQHPITFVWVPLSAPPLPVNESLL